MAKKRGRPRGGKNRTTQAAETIGTALGSVMARVDAWMAQRAEIAQELRDVADRIMSGENPFPRNKVTTPSMVARQIAVTNLEQLRRRGEVKPGRKFTLSAEARKRISEAQKARWAARKAKSAKRARKAKPSGDRDGEAGNS